jgi:HAD superfamily hydrolase (TIGR01549 family)
VAPIYVRHIRQLDISQLKALIFDVDGTLYRQRPVRYGMLWRLLGAYVRQPAQSLLMFRVLHAYRRAQEVLRASHLADGSTALRQLQLACEWTGVAPEFAEACVTRWMEQEPLALVARSRRAGVVEFLETAKERGVRLGICSDYPPTAKLRALGIAHFFEVVVSAQDPEVRQFKPSPRGLETALRRLGVSQFQALYIGDRPEVDAVAASSAGIACVIIGRHHSVDWRGWNPIWDYWELQKILWREEPV